MPSCQELAGRLAAGERAALEECYAALRPMVYGYVRRYVGHDDADDVLQSVFVEVWRVQGRYDPQRSLEGWVLGIARKRAIDHLRRRPRAAVPLDDVGRIAVDGYDQGDRYATILAVRSALASLPWQQRQALELAYFGDFSQREIAERLDTPLGTVKARIARGMRRLAAMLECETG